MRRALRAGDWIVVRSKVEILHTLDRNGQLEGLPFQPEMFAYCGRRMRVAKSAHKTCDNIRNEGGRRMRGAVHLEGSRCDGSAHGGCQADCMFFWKEAWLRRESDVETVGTGNGASCTEEMICKAVVADGDDAADDPTWVCQTTALYNATTPLHWWDVRQYIRDVTSGNHSASHLVKLLIAAAYRKFVQFGYGYNIKIRLYNAIQRVRGGKPYPVLTPAVPEGAKTPTELLDLNPGEWVEIKPTDEIFATLNQQAMNRGMAYTDEMMQYSGGRFRVQMRVDRLINEKTGKMMEMKNPCIQLEDVFCRACMTSKRIGCPRASNTYWREIWLKRVEETV